MTDYKRAEQIISAGFKFLMSLGFDEPAAEMQRSKLLGNSLLMSYKSESAQRQIEVCYLATNTSRAAAVSLFVCDLGGNRFSLEDWVKKKIPTSRLRFLADQISDSEKTFLECFCLECRSLLEGPLRDTIMGKSWDSVDLDWKGYR